jgi:choline dehydrogenase-like flavoprotein
MFRVDTAEAIDQGLTGEALVGAVRDRASRRCPFNTLHEHLHQTQDRLALANDRPDPPELARPSIYCSVGVSVRDSARHAAKIFRDIVATLDASIVSIGDGSDGFAPNNHIMGATILGNDPANAVVDATCRTNDHDNLYSASSSVFPSAGCVNSTLTIAVLALRVGDTMEARMT